MLGSKLTRMVTKDPQIYLLILQVSFPVPFINWNVEYIRSGESESNAEGVAKERD